MDAKEHSKEVFRQKKHQRKEKSLDVNELCNEVRLGNNQALSKAITLLESDLREDKIKARELIQLSLSQTQQNSIRIGITGTPGVGKSTLIEHLGMHLISLGKKVAVLAVDPSSTYSSGSILGDKTRMTTLAKHTKAFVRPSATNNFLGGVSKGTKDIITLCEWAQYDVILIETVGVGQSEIMVHDMVDMFLLLQQSGGGDELQGIKRGIMEMADAIVITKADGNNKEDAQAYQQLIGKALHLLAPKEGQWEIPVLLSSSEENIGIDTLWITIENYISNSKAHALFFEKRKKQNAKWFYQTLKELLESAVHNDSKVKLALPELLQKVEAQHISPFDAAKTLLHIYRRELK